jgi:hypothetical protein
MVQWLTDPREIGRVAPQQTYSLECLIERDNHHTKENKFRLRENAAKNLHTCRELIFSVALSPMALF